MGRRRNFLEWSRGRAGRRAVGKMRDEGDRFIDRDKGGGAPDGEPRHAADEALEGASAFFSLWARLLGVPDVGAGRVCGSGVVDQ